MTSIASMAERFVSSDNGGDGWWPEAETLGWKRWDLCPAFTLTSDRTFNVSFRLRSGAWCCNKNSKSKHLLSAYYLQSGL